MPKLTVELDMDEIATLIDSLSEGEKETLLIKLDKPFYAELKKRIQEMPDQIKSGEALRLEDVFKDVYSKFPIQISQGLKGKTTCCLSH